MIAVVDTGGANLASIGNALERLGERWQLTSDAATIRGARHIILPGVGAAGASMTRLRSLGLDALLPTVEQPVLGICLGMQLLFAHSAEDEVACLGVIDAPVVAMTPSPGVRVPHMGWNRVQSRGDTPLLQGIDDGSPFYFVHSFCAADGPWVVAECDHGGTIAAIVQRENFYGCQFHPERSGDQGAHLLRNFLAL